MKSAANMTDVTPAARRKTYEGELREREARIAELKRQMTALEDAAIKKMPAEDQRAAEGPDRPQVVDRLALSLAIHSPARVTSMSSAPRPRLLVGL